MIPVIYIASPYTRTTSIRREQAVAVLSEAVVRAGGLAVSPVLGGDLAERAGFADAQSEEWWYAATIELLSRCDGMLGWSDYDRSKGVNSEMDWCAMNAKPMRLVEHIVDLGVIGNAASGQARSLVDEIRRKA